MCRTRVDSSGDPRLEARMRRSITLSGLVSAGTDVGLAALYLMFAFVHVRAFLAGSRPSVALIVVFETTFAVLFLSRGAAGAVSRAPAAWAATLAGTFGPLLLRPVAGAHDSVVAQTVQVGALSFALYALFSLRRSVGLLPANRGVRSTGAYRCVRHPLYAAYTVANAGYLASNWSSRNVAIFFVALVAQLVRLRLEEDLLLQDPAYQAYARETPWRLVPFLY